MPHRSVRDVIAKQKPLTAPGNTTIVTAARLMKKHSIGALMIVEDGHLAGIFTERDAVFRVLAASRDPKTTHVADVMTTKPKTIGPDKAVGHALLMMYDGGFRHVPVVEHGKPLGMISARDALGPELQEFEGQLLQRDHIGEVMR
jgi:CBS domain-containing protein